jgi:hypothetical protein
MPHDFKEFDPVASRVRVIELENGNKLRLTATDPYGLIYLSLEHGQLPDSLKGAAFTEWGMAEKAAETYIAQRTKAIAEIAAETKKKKTAS